MLDANGQKISWRRHASEDVKQALSVAIAHWRKVLESERSTHVQRVDATKALESIYTTIQTIKVVVNQKKTKAKAPKKAKPTTKTGLDLLDEIKR